MISRGRSIRLPPTLDVRHDFQVAARPVAAPALPNPGAVGRWRGGQCTNCIWQPALVSFSVAVPRSPNFLQLYINIYTHNMHICAWIVHISRKWGYAKGRCLVRSAQLHYAASTQRCHGHVAGLGMEGLIVCFLPPKEIGNPTKWEVTIEYYWMI
jgi:hypothetical protein